MFRLELQYVSLLTFYRLTKLKTTPCNHQISTMVTKLKTTPSNHQTSTMVTKYTGKLIAISNVSVYVYIPQLYSY